MMKQAKMQIALVVAALSFAALAGGCSPQPQLLESEPVGVSSVVDKAQEDNSNVGTVAVDWTTDVDCGMCHDAEAGSFSGSATAAAHMDLAESCMLCHADEAGLAEVHEGLTENAKPAKRLKRTVVDGQVCLSCHNPTELAEITGGSTALVDSDGTAVNPHAMPESESHESLSCSSCHKMHSGIAMADSAQAACMDCHHSGVYECYTCHE